VNTTFCVVNLETNIYLCTNFGTHIFGVMEILEISSRQFRDKQRFFFDLADSGKKVVIRRGNKQSYVLTPVQDNDIVFSPAALQRIDESIEQIQHGECVKYTPELEHQLFGDYV
jgi:hypothetical protein